jgi:hypothetical protein
LHCYQFITIASLTIITETFELKYVGAINKQIYRRLFNKAHEDQLRIQNLTKCAFGNSEYSTTKMDDMA